MIQDLLDDSIDYALEANVPYCEYSSKQRPEQYDHTRRVTSACGIGPGSFCENDTQSMCSDHVTSPPSKPGVDFIVDIHKILMRSTAQIPTNWCIGPVRDPRK